jgi:hypothetical protein
MARIHFPDYDPELFAAEMVQAANETLRSAGFKPTTVEEVRAFPNLFVCETCGSPKERERMVNDTCRKCGDPQTEGQMVPKENER